MKQFLMLVFGIVFILSGCCKDPVKIETVRYENIAVSIPEDLLSKEEVPEPYTLDEVKNKPPYEVYKVMGVYQIKLLNTIKNLNDRLDLISKNQKEQIKIIEGNK